MKRLFYPHMLKVLEETRPKRIFEIGVCAGETTLELLKWCSKNNAQLDSVDPVEWSSNILPDEIKRPCKGYVFKREDKDEEVKIEAPALEEAYKSGLFKFWNCHKDLSINFFSKNKINEKFDMFIIDGDHNYYTVANELKFVTSLLKDRGTILFHDVWGKWRRNDQYYDPSLIPNEFKNKEKQGVITAIEDFLDKNNGISKGQFAILEKTLFNFTLNWHNNLKNKNLLFKFKLIAKILFNKNILSHASLSRIVDDITSQNESKILAEKHDYEFEIITTKFNGLGIIKKNDEKKAH